MDDLQEQAALPGAHTEYCAEYTHDGARWALNFFAADDADAERKLQSIKQSLILGGRLAASIPSDPRVSCRKKLEPHLVHQICGLRQHQVKDAISLLLDYIDASVDLAGQQRTESVLSHVTVDGSPCGPTVFQAAEPPRSPYPS